MQLLDHTRNTPAENIALDEALLLSNPIEGILRFWESPSYFVVVGASNKVLTETHHDQCQADAIPIIRRCSGGGTVLQGPGCLNYALILPQDWHPDLQLIQSTNHHILNALCEALRPIIPEIVYQGHTDLTINAIKISGNAQRRSKTHILFHGTFLYHFELELVTRYLAMPSKEPDYRKGRPHSHFIKNLSVEAKDLKDALSSYWKAKATPTQIPQVELTKLLETRYSLDTWNYKL